MAMESSEMDSLFEGMDFVEPSEDELRSNSPMARGLKSGELDSEPSKSSAVVFESSKPSLITPETAFTGSSLPQNLTAQSRHFVTDLPSGQPASHSSQPDCLTPGNKDVPEQDASDSLEDGLFTGLSVNPSIPERRNLTGGVLESVEIFPNRALNISGTEISLVGITTPSTKEKLSSIYDLVDEGRVSNVDDGISSPSTLSAYSDPASNVNDFKPTPTGNLSLPRTDSGTLASPTTSTQKQPIRRKRRGMKIGYGREVEENEDSSARTGISEAIGAALLGKEGANGGSGNLSARSSFSRSGSQNAAQMSLSTAESGLTTERSGHINGVDLAKQMSDVRISESQYSTLEVHGIERVASREMPEDILAGLTSNKTEVMTAFQSNFSASSALTSDIIDPSATVDTTVVVETTKEISGTGPKEISSSPGAGASLQMQDLELSTYDDETEEETQFELTVQRRRGSVEERLQFAREIIDTKLMALRERMSSVSALRKGAVQRRRRDAEKVAAASSSLKQLEDELDVACEKEDFDRADILSGRLVTAEVDMVRAGEDLSSAEAACDSLASKLQEVLEWQITYEERGADAFESVKKEADYAAEMIFNEARETATREEERLMAEEEITKRKASELDLELKGLEEANAELNTTIEGLTSSEIKEKEALTQTRHKLMLELEELLDMVKRKEADIADCDERIVMVEQKVSSVAGAFEEQRTGLHLELEARKTFYLQLQKDRSLNSSGKRGIQLTLDEAEVERQGFLRVAGLAAGASAGLRESATRKKAAAETMKQSRDKKMELVEKEKRLQADSQLLRQNSSSTRSQLQELTSARAKLNHELTAVKEQISFAEKKGLELDKEKKMAAAARNFKLADLIAAEARTLAAEREAASTEMERRVKDLETKGGEADVIVCTLADFDALLLAKEKEIGIVRCQSLRLVAEAAREERDFALEAHDSEEIEALKSEAAIADAEADRLQDIYQLAIEGHEYENESKVVLQESTVVVNSAIADDVTNEEHQKIEIFYVEADAGSGKAVKLDSLHVVETSHSKSETSGRLDSEDLAAAMVECERLRVLGRIEREKRDAAVLIDNYEEAEIFDNNAEAADAEADRLQKSFNLQGFKYDKQQKIAEE